jgi:hypothetical protein
MAVPCAAFNLNLGGSRRFPFPTGPRDEEAYHLAQILVHAGKRALSLDELPEESLAGHEMNKGFTEETLEGGKYNGKRGRHWAGQ